MYVFLKDCHPSIFPCNSQSLKYEHQVQVLRPWPKISDIIGIMYIVCKYVHCTLSEEYLIPEVLPRKEAKGGGEGCQKQPECLERSRSEKTVEIIF